MWRTAGMADSKCKEKKRWQITEKWCGKLQQNTDKVVPKFVADNRTSGNWMIGGLLM